MKCPSCKHNNIPGEDRCRFCMHSLMQRDLPKRKKGETFQNIMMTPVSEIIKGDHLLIARPDDSIHKLIKIFRQEKRHCALVYRRKKIIGIISKRDILKKVAIKYKNLYKIKVESIMSPLPGYVMPEDPIGLIVNKMSLGGFRHIPVLTDKGAPLDIISIIDIFTHIIECEKRK